MQRFLGIRLLVMMCMICGAAALAGGAGRPASAAGQLQLSVDAAAELRPISALIYGINSYGFSSAELEQLNGELRVPLQRWGGNLASRYNWQNDMANHGRDFYFESIPEDNPDPAHGNAVDHLVALGQRTGTATMVEVPMIGWVAKARSTPNGGYDCSFSTVKYAYTPRSLDDAHPEQSHDTDDPNSWYCGTGRRADGSYVTGNDRTDANIPADSAFMAGWVNHLATTFGPASAGGVQLYGLDNEPGIWADTHRDVAPDYLSYQALLDRTLDYAAAIKAADQGAQTLGPAQDGWARYFFSGYLDQFAGQAIQDRANHAGKPFVAWYLEQMRADEQQRHMRLLDYLDLHYYPQAVNDQGTLDGGDDEGVALAPAGNPQTQALRLRSTRALWDPTYADESWIADTDDGPVVQLLPRMRAWVDQNYPGTKLAISEYNWGGAEHINGALAQADVLGIFGREGLDAAMLFGAFGIDQPLAYAFRMYRNYDGAGAQFGTTHVRASSADQDTLAIYAAQRAQDGALTLMVVNKTASSQPARIELTGFGPAASAAVYRYSSANLGAIVHAPDQVVQPDGFSASLPADSITLFVVASAAGAPGLQPAIFLPMLAH